MTLHKNTKIMKIHNFFTKDNREVKIRYLSDDDIPLLLDMYRHLSHETKRLRFHIYGSISDNHFVKKARVLTKLDPLLQVALLATIQEEDGEHIVGVTHFSRETPDGRSAEIAIVVRDDYQSVGLGRHLLQELAKDARLMQINTFRAWVLSENRVVMDIILKMGFTVKYEMHRGETFLTISLLEHFE